MNSIDDTSPLPWYQVWLRTLNPSLRNYEDLAARAPSSMRTALVWQLGGAVLVDTVVLLNLIVTRNPGLAQAPVLTIVPGFIGVTLVALGKLIIFSSLAHGIALILGGKGRFGILACIFAALFSMCGIFSEILSLINFALYAYFRVVVIAGNFPVPVYWLLVSIAQIILATIAVNAIYPASWKRAIIAVIPMMIWTVYYSFRAFL
jgi:hypothetical protein